MPLQKFRALRNEFDNSVKEVKLSVQTFQPEEGAVLNATIMSERGQSPRGEWKRTHMIPVDDLEERVWFHVFCSFLPEPETFDLNAVNVNP